MEYEYSEEEYQDDFDKFTQEDQELGELKAVEYLWARLSRPKTKSFLSVCVGSMPIHFVITDWVKETWPDWTLEGTFTDPKSNF